MIAPNVFVGYFRLVDTETFYERLREDHEICYQRFKDDNVPPSICNEIRKSAVNAYREASSRDYVTVPLLTGIIFALGLGLIGLKGRIEELKEKIDV